MKSKIILQAAAICLFTGALCLENASAQNRKGGGGGGGARPSGASRPAAKPSAAQKPSSVQKPAASTRQSGGSGGIQKPSTNQVQKNSGNQISRDGNKNVSKDRDIKNTNVSNNKVNVDKSRGDVNINVDNSKNIKVNNNRNTVVRHNTYRPYTRPPYVYGGYRYRCYRPYYYHPYRPFYWGPAWHPWGFFIATLATTAIIVSFADVDLPGDKPQDYYAVNYADVASMPVQSGPSENTYVMNTSFPVWNDDQKDEYYFDQGVFYLKGNGGYTVVAAPVGAIVPSLPSGFETITLDDAGSVKNYYYGGSFYEKHTKGYKVVAPTSGSVIQNLPEGGEEVKMGDITYVKVGETYYQPVQENGKNAYEVANVEEDK